MCKLKTNNIAIILTLMTFVIFANSCAPFRTKFQVDKNIMLTKQNIYKINKTFKSVPNLISVKTEFSPKKTLISDSLNRYNLLEYIERNDQNKTAQKINTDYNVKILLKDESNISFYSLKNDDIIDSISFKYKLKKDGFLYIKDSNFKMGGVPFIFGWLEANRRRLGLNPNDNLIFESSYYRIGAFLIFIGDDRKLKSSSLFSKIK